MERGMIWFKCAAVHDAVRPVVREQAVLGCEAKERRVDLTIERPPTAEDLLFHMKGWFTADVRKAAEVINQYGTLKLLDDRHLVVESLSLESLEALAQDLKKIFGSEVWVDVIPKKRLV